jgi:thymidine phosphorylase
MPTLERSKALAESLVSVANGAGLRTGALITNMNEPLASAAGNALEVRNAVDFLTGAHRDPRLLEVTLALSAAALRYSGFAGDARAAVDAALASGRPVEHFARMVALLGGPADLIENMDRHLAAAPIVRDVPAGRSGVVVAIDTRGVGMGVVALGGGRRLPTDSIDHAVGFDRLLGLGAAVTQTTALARVHARSEAQAEEAAARLAAAYVIGDEAPASHPLVALRIDPM